MIRVRDWRRRLYTWADQQVGLPFVWGQTDCATLVRQALYQLYGGEVFPHLPKWTTAREALSVVHRFGSVASILLSRDAVLTTLPFLRSGDVVVAVEPEEEAGRVACFVCIDGSSCLTSMQSHGVLLITQPPSASDPKCVYTLWEIPDGQ